MKRCLILGCSEAKIDTAGKLPALDRYDGPPFRVLRQFLSGVPLSDPRRQLDVFVLSAEYGLIKGDHCIPVYDQRMTPQRAAELQPDVLRIFQEKIVPQNYGELFLSMGKIYLAAISGYETMLSQVTKVVVSQSSSGRKLTELKKWLTGEDEQPQQLALPLNGAGTMGYVSPQVKGAAILQGVTLNLTPEQVYQFARQALATKNNNAFNFKDWYILIDKVKVSPKWLVSQLSGVPVSHFDASAARRVLTNLRIPLYRNE
jgi:hypothetical protein